MIKFELELFLKDVFFSLKKLELHFSGLQETMETLSKLQLFSSQINDIIFHSFNQIKVSWVPL